MEKNENVDKGWTPIPLPLKTFFVLFTIGRSVPGLPQILVPTLVSAIFIAVIYWQRDYFAQQA